MEVLLLSNCPVVEYQGSGYVIANTAKSLSALGHQVKIIPPSELLFMSFLKGRAHVYHLAIGMATWIFKNRSILAKYQLIVLYGAETLLALILIKNILKLPVPVILHSNGLEVHVSYTLSQFSEYVTLKKKWFHFNLNSLYKYCYKKVSAIITVSKYDYDFAINHLQIPMSKVFYNEPGLPEMFFDENLTDKVVKEKIITFCGSWIDRKGIDSIKAAVPAILRKYTDYSFRMIGVGEMFNPRDYFPSDLLSRITIHPIVRSKKQMIDLYRDSSIFLFPSFCESFGLVVAEAMHCHCAVITGPTGFAADLKNDEEAIVLDLPDAPHVFDALEKLIVNRKFRESLAVNGRKRTEVLTWENYKVKLEAIINDISNRGEALQYALCATPEESPSQVLS